MSSVPPTRVLVICLRRLGDVLLATPLIRSLRRAYPAAAIDAVVFAPTAAALEGNPDLRRVIAWPKGLGQQWRTLSPLFRAYDLACAITPSDRAQFLAWWAAPRRAITVQPSFPRRWLPAHRVMCMPDSRHTVAQGLALAEVLGVPAVAEVVPPRPADTLSLEAALGADWAQRPYAVLHPVPMFRYKAWTEDGWRALIGALQARGLRVVISGGPGADERAYVESLLAPLSVDGARLVNVAGRLKLAELTPLLEHARLYVGPDTSITHLAAASGVPTLALFGPSSPIAWGPWPRGHEWAGGDTKAIDSPWQLVAPTQRVGNVTIVQGVKSCVPCLQEGCERRLDSRSACLDELPLARVLVAVDAALAPSR